MELPHRRITLSPPKPLAPIDESFIDDRTPCFDWEEVVEAPLYSLKVSEHPNVDTPYIIFLDKLEDSKYQMQTELIPGKTYYWAVQARDGDQWGNWCEPQEFYLRFEDPDYEYDFDDSREWILDYGNYSYRSNPSRLHHAIYFQRIDQPNIAYEPFAHHLEPGDNLTIEFEFTEHNDPEDCLGMYHGLISYLSITLDRQSDMIASHAHDNNGQPEVNLTIVNDMVVETIGAGENWSQGYGRWLFEKEILNWTQLLLTVSHNGTQVHHQEHTLTNTDFRSFLTIYAAVAAFKDKDNDQWNNGRGYTGDFYRLSVLEGGE